MKRSALIGWGIGSFTSATLVGAVGLLHLRFMTDSLGLSIALAGLLVGLSKIYDAALDPIMGVVSDRTRTPWGRHRPYLFGGGLMCALSLILLFNVPQSLTGTGLTLYVSLSLVLFSTAYTMFRIPYLALGRSITQDFNERSKLMTFSVYGSSLGGLAATSAAPYLLATLGSDRAGHGLVAWVLGAMIAIGGIVSFFLIDTEAAEPLAAGGAVEVEHASFRDAWAALRENKPFQHLMGFKVMMFAGFAVHGSAIPYYTRHVLGASDMVLSSVFLAQTLAMMGSQFFWVRIARRYGRRNALMSAALAEVLVLFSWYLVPYGHPMPWLQILGLLQGICTGGIFFGLYTVLTDTMDHAGKTASGAGREGIFAGVFVMVEKATAAFGAFLFSAILGWVGYISAKDAGSVQPHAAIVGISIALSVLPALAAISACLFLRKLRLPEASAPRSRDPQRVKAAVSLAVGILVLGGLAGATGSAKAADIVVPTRLMIDRVYTRADGLSTMDQVELPRVTGGDGRSVGTRLYATDVELGMTTPGTFIDWHGVTTPRMLMIVAGELEIGLGDGTKHVLKPGNIVLVMDTTGRGHTSRMVGTVPVEALTLRLPKENPLAPKLNTCPPDLAPDKCVANGLVITHSKP